MAEEYKLSYTASEIDEKLGKIDNLAFTMSGLDSDVRAIQTLLPSVTPEDAGKFLCVSSDGTLVTESIPVAEGVGF